MFGKTLSICALLLLSAAAVAGAQTFPFYCSLGYEVSTSGAGLYNTAVDRVCAVQIIFENSSGSGETSRTYSCTIAASTSSCSLTIDPGASSVPSGFSPTAALTAPLQSSVEESNGCVYAVVNGFTAPPQQYPTATVSTMMGLQVTVLHYFDCTSAP